MMKKVSILVPIYGVEKFIEQCLVSLFEQTYQDIEYVFVNDCSPDKSVELLQDVLQRYPNRKQQVKLIQHKQNRGSGAARLTGMQNVTGELLMFVDSDDYISLDCVEKLVAKQEETDADIVDGVYSMFSNEQVLSTTYPFDAAAPEGNYLKGLLIHNTVSHQIWARVFRRELFEGSNVTFIEGVDHGEDYSIMGRLLLHASRACIDDVIYYYRYNDYGTFADGISKRHITSFLKANGLVIQYIRANDTSGKYEAAMQIGLLHICYCAVKVGTPVSEVYAFCGTPTCRFAKCCLFFAKPFFNIVLRWIYLMVKKLYKIFVLRIK